MMIDFEKIKTLYQFGKNIALKDIQVLLKAANKKVFQPSDYLIKEGSLSKEVFYIRKGLIRTFVVNNKGDEITTAIICEHHIATNKDIILFQEPSQLYFQALEKTETFSLDYDLIQTIVANNPKLEASRKHILQKHLKTAYKRIDSFLLYSPEERYLQYVQDNPDIMNRVPNKYIANVLGITPVSLSRIRKRIATKK